MTPAGPDMTPAGPDITPAGSDITPAGSDITPAGPDMTPAGPAMTPARPYRGRIAPTPTGHLHLGHARTFWVARQRASQAGGIIVLRIEDLDPQRCRPAFADAMLEDLRWFGLTWEEGPDVGGPFGPYVQSQRRPLYLEAWRRLKDAGLIYPCSRSRQDVRRAAQAPHPEEEDAEPLYPIEWRPPPDTGLDATHPAGVNWRFRVPDGEVVRFRDGRYGEVAYEAGRDFGDFLVWRRDDVPAYELAVVVDDAATRISEVVRGVDLLRSTARQLLLYRALGLEPPDFFHCPLMTDEQGRRLAKRTDALSLRAMRAQGLSPDALREGWDALLELAPPSS
jgi:glutamyl-tRNA synthetase